MAAVSRFFVGRHGTGFTLLKCAIALLQMSSMASAMIYAYAYITVNSLTPQPGYSGKHSDGAKPCDTCLSRTAGFHWALSIIQNTHGCRDLVRSG
jgi:hypothetical protein